MSKNRQFGVTDGLAIPVDDIAAINIREEREVSRFLGFRWLFGTRTIPGAMLIRTHNGPNAYIQDAARAKKFVRSLEDATDIYGPRADDLIREIDRCLT